MSYRFCKNLLLKTYYTNVILYQGSKLECSLQVKIKSTPSPSFKLCITLKGAVLNREVLLSREGSVRLTSLYQLVYISAFLKQNIIYLFYYTTYLKKVNCTKPSPQLVFLAISVTRKYQTWVCLSRHSKTLLLLNRYIFSLTSLLLAKCY